MGSRSSSHIALACMLYGLDGPAQAKPADSGSRMRIEQDGRAAVHFRSFTGDFEWDYYEKFIDEIDEIQTGTIYSAAAAKRSRMMAGVKQAGRDTHQAETRNPK